MEQTPIEKYIEECKKYGFTIKTEPYTFSTQTNYQPKKAAQATQAEPAPAPAEPQA